MSFFGRVWSWARGLFRRGPLRLKTVRVEEAPEVLNSRTVYLLGEGEHIWSITLLCPCGCGEQIQLSAVGGRPKWSVDIDGNGSVTLAPSVWRKVGCRSHFLLRGGVVQWCSSKVQGQPRAGE